MRRHFKYCLLSVCVLCPWDISAATPDCGFEAFSNVFPEGTTRNLQVAVPITEELGQDDVHLSFFSWYQVSQSTKGKVMHQVSIYRGQERLWTKKRTVKLEKLDFTADSWNSFCDAYKKGLEPGDLVVFDFGLVGHSISGDNGVELRVLVGPRQMWTINTYPWDSWRLDCP